MIMRLENLHLGKNTVHVSYSPLTKLGKDFPCLVRVEDILICYVAVTFALIILYSMGQHCHVSIQLCMDAFASILSETVYILTKT